MDTVRGIDAPFPRLTRPVATLGGFDGVHRGHRLVLAQTVAWAREVGGEALVITFDPLPKAVVAPAEALCITSLDHRLLLLGRAGVDLTVVLDFDASLARMEAAAFVEDVILGRIGAAHVVLGFNSTFGHRGQGNADLLRAYERQGLLELRVPGPVRHRGQIISSTAIRQAVGAGRLDEAAAMLGRPVSLLGTVAPGDGRGRALGFPTANLDLHHEAAPPPGVYATLAILDGVRHPAITYIGSRPTFHPDATAPSFEVHVIDLDADLYGREVEVEFARKLRSDIRFPSSQALVDQMHADRGAALQILRGRL